MSRLPSSANQQRGETSILVESRPFRTLVQEHHANGAIPQADVIVTKENHSYQVSSKKEDLIVSAKA
jgi:hypothetical protein